MNHVTILCGSRKPAPNVDRHSSSRELLRAVHAGLDDKGCPWVALDLRDLDIPQFDGRECADYGVPGLDEVRKQLASTEVLVVSVPAYWNAASGPLVNLFNVVGGANYDLDPDRPLPLENVTAILVTVGADESSAYLAASQMRGMLSSMGAWVAPREVTIGNPRNVRNMAKVVAELRELGRYAATVAPR
jgi:NAD(P)H-dependent FMN reductase